MKISLYFFRMSALLLLLSSLVAYTYDETYRKLDCTITPIIQTDVTRSHPLIPGPRSSRSPANESVSTNWAGYIGASNFTSPAKNSVSSVFGTWIVPQLKLMPTLDNSYCALWVGIDGFGSPTVEQIGTSHNWMNGMQEDYVWFEMYPNSAFLINNFPITPGDVMSASVTYAGNDVFVLTIVNNTQKAFFTVPTSYTTSSIAQRSSAEWVVEAPYLNGTLPLADFMTAYLWGCAATINGIHVPINNPFWQHLVIQMTTPNGTPKAVTSPLLPDNGSFFVSWEHE